MTDFPTKHESNRANDISGVAFTMYNYTLIKIVESKSWAQYDQLSSMNNSSTKYETI
jgi:hypothetical protein